MADTNQALAMPVLITSAVHVSSAQTVYCDEQKRLQETLSGLMHWVATPSVRQVVICDGSGFDFAPALTDLRSAYQHVEIEALTFTNDIDAVRARGKGYGEGEIVNHALVHSRILAAAPAFAKCTGKLWVSNFAKCLRGFNGTAAFDYNGKLTPQFIDTRFYLVDKGFHRDVLAQAYREVDDTSGFYLEHAYQKALASRRLADYVMCPTPRIRGVSGSMGVAYQTQGFKALLRDVRSRLVRGIGI